MARPDDEIQARLRQLERRLTDPKLKHSAIPLLNARMEELTWVLGLSVEDD